MAPLLHIFDEHQLIFLIPFIKTLFSSLCSYIWVCAKLLEGAVPLKGRKPLQGKEMMQCCSDSANTEESVKMKQLIIPVANCFYRYSHSLSSSWTIGDKKNILQLRKITFKPQNLTGAPPSWPVRMIRLLWCHFV